MRCNQYSVTNLSVLISESLWYKIYDSECKMELTEITNLPDLQSFGLSGTTGLWDFGESKQTISDRGSQSPLANVSKQKLKYSSRH